MSISEEFFLFSFNDEERKLANKQFEYFVDYREALFVGFGFLQEVTKIFLIELGYNI